MLARAALFGAIAVVPMCAATLLSLGMTSRVSDQGPPPAISVRTAGLRPAPAVARPAPLSIREHLQVAAGSIRAGDLGTAELELRLVSRLSPDNLHARRALALLRDLRTPR